MKTFVSLLATVFVALAPTAATPQPPPGQDEVGIYTGDFTGPTETYWEGTGPVEVYVVISRVSCSPEAGLAGWELKVNLEGIGAALTGVALLGQGAVNLYAPPEFCVGLSAPLMAGPYGTFPVARLTYLVQSLDPTHVRIGPTRISSVSGLPCYASWDDMCELIRLSPVSGSVDLPVFGFNTGPAVATEGRTWGGMRGLYR